MVLAVYPVHGLDIVHFKTHIIVVTAWPAFRDCLAIQSRSESVCK